MSGIISDNQGRSSGLVKAAAAAGGAWTLIKTLTSDGSDANLSFVNGTSSVVLDATYSTYCFIWTNIHPETDDAIFKFNGSIDSGSNYNVTKTTSLLRHYYSESGAGGVVNVDTAQSISSGTGDASLATYHDNDNDSCCGGWMYLYNPASTTFIKQFRSNAVHVQNSAYLYNMMCAGYFNTTSAINAITFKFSTDEIQAGKISLYGIST